MAEQIRIHWYRSRINKAVMSELMQKSDRRAFAQVLPQLALYALTGILSFLAFRNIDSSNSWWSIPVLLLALFMHGTFASFFGAACHELCHKTPFKSPPLNEFFLRVYAFLSWFDPVSYRMSHVKHHQATVHQEHDGEVILPTGLNWCGVQFFAGQLLFSPAALFQLVRNWCYAASGNPTKSSLLTESWMEKLYPEEHLERRRERRRWARVLLLGHCALAACFVFTGHWFLIVIVTFGCHYCGWFQMLCAAPQHVGLSPNVRDFRLCCRTYLCHWFPAFLYWNMQYHIEHHMFPAVPFYNLPKLRKAIEHDLPPAPHGLYGTWREIIPILQRQRRDPSYVHVPCLPDGGIADCERVETCALS